ncbi:MAG: RNase J family beta-CASP ribonuclease [Acidimicrobiia bacterium]|nr:RNase J family beta-CASP ribonuclease [Acidimicrobiia bacterium]
MADPVTVTFLGGLGEIGRNCAVIECRDEMVLLDCGLMFPGQDMPGIDLVLPDFTFILENRHKLKGVVLTHGHEDHVGGLAYLLREVSLPLYGSPFTLGLARNRIEEAGLLGRTQFIPVQDGDRLPIGPLEFEFIPVTHSVPSGHAVAVRTPQGVLLHSGDFKLDTTPVDGRLCDLARIGAIADGEGVRLLLSDSTNADESGWSRSESQVGSVLYDLFHDHRGRRIVTVCFSSHIHRVQQIADAAIEQGRVVATLGMSMRKNVKLARSMGLLHIPADRLVDIEQTQGMDPGKVCVISTGSQGEPYSALALMASGESRFIKIGPDDTVILSSSPIPGNESNVNKVMNGLMRLGAKVVHSGIADVHATGHARAEELKLYLNLTRPRFMVPVHGEPRHLRAHAQLASQVGVDLSRVLVCEDGDQVVMSDRGVMRGDRVRAGHLYVDGIVGDVGRGVLRDRRVLAEEGVVVVIVAIDVQERAIVTGPEVITRGWVYAPEAEELLDEAADVVRREVDKALGGDTVELDVLQQVIRRAAGRFVNERTRRKPMIVPVVMES